MKALLQIGLMVLMMGASAAQAKTPSIVGVWELDYSTNFMPDGSEVPYCSGAHGFIIYSKEGVMSVALNCAKAVEGAATEPADSTGRRFFYTGKYDFDGVDVVHHLLNASEVDLVGTSFTRHVKVTKNRLELGGEISGQSFVAVWKRLR